MVALGMGLSGNQLIAWEMGLSGNQVLEVLDILMMGVLEVGHWILHLC